MVEEEDFEKERSNVINDGDSNSFNRRNGKKQLGQANFNGEHGRITNRNVRSGQNGLKRKRIVMHPENFAKRIIISGNENVESTPKKKLDFGEQE